MQTPNFSKPLLRQPWMDSLLHEAIRRLDVDYGHVAWRVCNLLTAKELLGLWDIPCADGKFFGDSTILLEICRAATMAATFRTEWVQEDRPALEIAAEAAFMTIRQSAFTGFQTLDNLMGLVIWDLAGRMYLNPADRAAYGMAAKACLYAGGETLEKGSEQFTFLMQQSAVFMAEGMGYDLAQNELNELASMMFNGITVADYRSQASAKAERELAKDFKQGIHLLMSDQTSMAQALGINHDEARGLMEADAQIIGYD